MLPAPALAAFRSALGPDRVLDDAVTRTLYAHDETPRQVEPDAVLFPTSHDDVVALARIAFDHRIALTPRGAGSGNVGGAMPTPGSVVVSFECMQRILEFDPDNRLIVVEPGVVTAEIERIARSAGLFYPPDPGSNAYCRIGGNLAMNAAGPRAVKYGVTRDYVLGLRAVTGSGQEIRTGCRTTKGVTGYDLTRLLVGSEGTLALMTEATLKLLPAPEAVATLRVSYASTRAALDAVSRIMRQQVTPCALEFMDHRALDAIRPTGATDDLPPGTRALLMVEADGAVQDVPRQIAALEKALAGDGLLDMKQRFQAATTSPSCGPHANRCRMQSSRLHRSRSTRTWWCRYRNWPTLLISSTKPPTRSACPSSRSVMPATATCTSISWCTPTTPTKWRAPTSRSTPSCSASSRWAARSRANTASAAKSAVSFHRKSIPSRWA